MCSVARWSSTVAAALAERQAAAEPSNPKRSSSKIKSNNGKSAESVPYETEETRRGVTQNVVSASVERLVQAPQDLLSRRVERRGQRGARRQRVAASAERRGYAVDPWTA